MPGVIVRRRSLLSSRPSWVLPEVVGRGLQYEFTRDQYWLGSGLTAQANVLADTRASDALFDNAAGVYSTFGTDVPAITDRGLYPGGSFTNDTTSADLTALTKGGNTTVTLMPDEVGPDRNTGSVYRLQMPASSSTFLALKDYSTVTATRTVAVFAKANGANNQFQFYQNITTSAVKEAGSDWAQFSYTATGNLVYGINNGTDSYATDILIWYPYVGAGAFAPPPIVPATTRAADAITNPNFSTHAATFGFANGMAALARVNITRLSDGAARRIATFGTATDGAYIEFTTSNTFKAVLRKSSADAVTLESGVVGSTGVYDVTATLDPGAYALTVSGGITGDTDASAETLPAAIANACYIGQKEDTTLHLNGPLERLAMWGV